MHLENAPAHTAWWVQQLLVAKSCLWFHTFLTRIMCRLVISTSFREWNLCYKGSVSTNSLNFWTRHYTRFPKAYFSGVSSSGRNVAWTQKGTTLKATATTRVKEKRVLLRTRSGNFSIRFRLCKPQDQQLTKYSWECGAIQHVIIRY